MNLISIISYLLIFLIAVVCLFLWCFFSHSFFHLDTPKFSLELMYHTFMKTS